MSEMSDRTMNWQSVADSVRHDRDVQRRLIKPGLHQLYTQIPHATQQYILSSTATQLVQDISTNKLQSRDIVIVYCYRALLLGEQYGSNGTELFQQAIDVAEQQDKERKQRRIKYKLQNSEPLPDIKLLEGIPLSVKDCFLQRDCISTCGLAAKTQHVYKQDGLLLHLLRQQGAIPFVRTNIPQAMMVPITECSIWGLCSNPYDKTRTPGGSSGGEGCLLGGYGSIIGMGTDIGGSVRIPGSWSGHTAFKPTPQRMTSLGIDKTRQDVNNKYTGNHVRSCAGPMTRSVDDCVTMLKCWWSAETYAADPYIPRLPFDDTVYQQNKKLRIGYYVNDVSLMDTCESVRRAVREAIQILQKYGHIIVPYTPPKCSGSLIRLWQQFFAGTGGIAQIEALNGEAPLQHYQHLTRILADSQLPYYKRITQILGKQKEVDKLLYTNNIGIPAYRYEEMQTTMVKLQYEYTAEWRGAGIDVLICPATALPAIKHTDPSLLFQAANYCALYNMVEYPAGVLPITTVQPNEQHYTSIKEKFNAPVNESLQGSSELPVAVQVVALPYHDELVLHVMKQIETEAHFYEKHKPDTIQLQ